MLTVVPKARAPRNLNQDSLRVERERDEDYD